MVRDLALSLPRTYVHSLVWGSEIPQVSQCNQKINNQIIKQFPIHYFKKITKWDLPKNKNMSTHKLA